MIAVLRFKRGRWYALEYSFFASDVRWHGLHQPLRAPKAIFPQPAADFSGPPLAPRSPQDEQARKGP